MHYPGHQPSLILSNLINSLMIRLIAIATITFFTFSCGDFCPGGKDVTELPSGFEEPVQGIISHSEWVYTSGNQKVDTLTALGAFRKNYIQSDCSEKEFGIRNFKWTILKGCETKEVTIEIHSRDLIHFDISSKGKDPNCIDGDFNYNLDTERFVPIAKFLTDFTTPMKVYDTTIVLPFYIANQEEVWFYTREAGIIGYTLDTDTFKLNTLK